ncbi:hypothetical protein Q73_02405 [Bacillus coahuilensis m2-6]|nr:hypothetical protein Q73_02405 [Bacillus coahuilensis m2-6]
MGKMIGVGDEEKLTFLVRLRISCADDTLFRAVPPSSGAAYLLLRAATLYSRAAADFLGG